MTPSRKMYSLKLIIILIIGFNFCAGRKPAKIVGGQNTHPGEIPYIVSLTIAKNNHHLCGGSLISAKHVLTAAHCFNDINSPEFWRKLVIITGATNRIKDGERHSILKVFVHPEFKTGSNNRWRNDIALITLKEPVKFTKNQMPISLPTIHTPSRVYGMISGWGRLSKDGKSPDILQKQNTIILSNHECLARGYGILDTNICAFNGQGTGFCLGDSGGPLVYNNQVVGIASFIIPCGAGMPDTYTRVDKYIEFIYRNMQ